MTNAPIESSSKYTRTAMLPISFVSQPGGTYIYVNFRGASSRPYHVVLWEQDGLTFVVSGVLPDKEGTIEIAKSMASEPALLSASQIAANKSPSTPNCKTWAQFSQSLPSEGGRGGQWKAFGDLPSKFQNGCVLLQDNNSLDVAYVLKVGMPISANLTVGKDPYRSTNIPTFNSDQSNLLDRLVERGDALVVTWLTPTNGAIPYLRSIPRDRAFLRKDGMTCFSTVCMKSGAVSHETLSQVLGNPGNIAANQSPSTPQAYKEMGDTRSSNGDKKGAIADYTEAIRLNSSFAPAYYNRAIDRVAIGDKQGAIADFKKAAELFGNQGRGSDRQDALSEIAKLGGERSPQGKPVLQTFKDAKALGMAQILQGNQRLVTSHGGLKRVVEGNYQIPEIPKSGFLDDRFTDVAETPGQLFGKRKDVSYADYLRLKFKVVAQQNALNQGANVVSTGVQEYLDLLAKDSRSGGKQTSDSVLTKFKDYYNQIQPRNKKITLGNLNYALEETRISTGELIQGTIKTGGKLAAAFTQLGKLAKTFDLPEIRSVSAYTKVGRSLEWTISMKQKLEELQRAANQGDNDKIRDLALDVASETLLLIDSQDTRLSRSSDAIRIRSVVMALKERDKFIREPKVGSVLDGLDKIYLVTAQASSAVEIIAATTTFIAPQNRAAVQLSEKLDALRALFFDALEFTYKEDVRKQHERLSVVSKRYEDILPGLFSTIDSSAEEIGQYLLKSRTDVVTRRSDGTIAVSINGVVNPPKP